MDHRQFDGVLPADRILAGLLEDPVKVDLMRRIKVAFDPNRSLNPGTIFSPWTSAPLIRVVATHRVLKVSAPPPSNVRGSRNCTG